MREHLSRAKHEFSFPCADSCIAALAGNPLPLSPWPHLCRGAVGGGGALAPGGSFTVLAESGWGRLGDSNR